MKKTRNIFFGLMVIPIVAFAQTNTFPTSGNVTINDGDLIQTGTSNDLLTQGAIKLKNYLLFDNDGDFTGGNYYTIQDDPTGNFLRIGYLFRNDLTITSSGNVGIGTTNPGSTKLRVNGNIRGTSHIAVETGGSYKVSMNGQSDGYIVGRDNAFQTKFRVSSNGSSYFNGGNVGIGTSSPDAELAVNGNIHAKEVKVDLIGWPDYVFSEDYDLPTLEEVEKHIKEKGHLINIPSAEEVKANGIQLGEMNKLLLEKIEELTLYMIELKKENKKLKEGISEMENIKRRLLKLEALMKKVHDEE
ncbi:hypothetical protein [Allomuricauda sp. SCSIO 65647]|uniref:hypothetical protein n=1 Tax=Allomuricauda sp. SCSIO 65647 TaxID=2908843 RepID=UPI001F18BDEA|nr:hypothetical protein [Muricauda sp. SCSIO 65647]UJH68659.1 hypothetical protein L0P89_05450 [Muricauda sp. SCSIO 65647]